MTIEIPNDELIPDADLAALWNCTRRTLARYTNEPDGLPICMLAGKIYRPRKACSAWLARRVQHPNPRRGVAS